MEQFWRRLARTARINLIQGTKGCLYDYPLRVALSPIPGGDATGHDNGSAHKWMDDAALAALKEKYRHPLWKTAGEVAKKGGGHGGMDFMMDLRWVWCLMNGLPLDADVYDLASWSAIVPCSAKSDMRGGEPVELPDFTRGAWRTAKPQDIGSVDFRKMGLDTDTLTKDKAEMSV